jgi:hypothetical protein
MVAMPAPLLPPSSSPPHVPIKPSHPTNLTARKDLLSIKSSLASYFNLPSGQFYWKSLKDYCIGKLSKLEFDRDFEIALTGVENGKRSEVGEESFDTKIGWNAVGIDSVLVFFLGGGGDGGEKFDYTIYYFYRYFIMSQTLLFHLHLRLVILVSTRDEV